MKNKIQKLVVSNRKNIAQLTEQQIPADPIRPTSNIDFPEDHKKTQLTKIDEQSKANNTDSEREGFIGVEKK